MEVHIKATRPWAAVPQLATSKAFGYDLQTTEALSIEPHSTVIAKTGLVLTKDLDYDLFESRYPDKDRAGIAMLILPRSSLLLKHGLIVGNAPGLIDADYTGEIGVILHNLTNEVSHIETGVRIAQALFVVACLPRIVDTTGVDTEARAERGGFGSTG